MNRADRYAMQLALCMLRDGTITGAASVLRLGGMMAHEVYRSVSGPIRDWDGDLRVQRVLRVRLALLLRALLRAEPDPALAELREAVRECFAAQDNWVHDALHGTDEDWLRRAYAVERLRELVK